jgi:hypothetical protein
MKTFSLILGIVGVVVSIANAGSEPSSNKEITPPPNPRWYADREWNVNLAAAFALTDSEYPTLENSFGEGAFGVARRFDHDRYLDADHAWGGSVDLKYFFCRYFGVGVQGFGLNVRQSYADVLFNFSHPVPPGVDHARTSHSREFVGGGLATFTLRYPIGSSRFAPYVFAGGGAVFGGGQLSSFQYNGIVDRTFAMRSGAKQGDGPVGRRR